MAKDTLKIHKRELVQVRKPLNSYTRVAGHRPITDQELARWYKDHEGDMMDDAGESRLPPTWRTDDLRPGLLLIVTKSRCRPHIGYHTYSGMVQALDPESGNTYYITRGNIQKLENNENSVHE